MGKKANGEGSTYKRMRDGKLLRWEGAVTYTDPDTGQTKRKVVYGRTQADVREKLKKLRERIDAGQPPTDSTRTVEDWLQHWRATTLAVSDRAVSTRAMYSDLSRKHLEPAPFGAIRLDKLKPSDIEGLILSLRAATKPGKTATDGAEPAPVRRYSDSTIRSVYAVLRQALDGAVRDGLLARNPAAQVKRPGVERREAHHIPAADVAALLQAADGLRYAPVLRLIAATGLRRGEALGLTWDRIDLDAGVLKVAATVGRVGKRIIVSAPKTERSRRTIPLSAGVVAMLKAHRKTQLEERMRAANLWEDNNLVFCTEMGRPVEPRNILRTIEIASEKAGVKGAVVHTLRHSAATAWLESGVHIKAVADLLGHSSIAITGDIYSHSTDDTARAAVAGLSSALGL
ncbi:site-specific integrase [Mycobacterium sp. EPa45]|uniref:tyrosine-type recombinase/integrase n=1 Tax=Mycobacterium sp. EPa45 TaxID=1545728 RepID=UPI000642059A|nr:site-specific integrase [Mycobacterium sp. EPa45]AKK28210.1 integrase [Mycobacterium sp. EPa45]